MSSVHVARQGFITKSALPSVTRTRGSTQVADKSIVLLLNGNGTNGAQNNTFLDSSTTNATVTRLGTTTQGSFSPFSLPDGQWSNRFSSDALLQASNSIGNFGTGDFTVEFWINAFSSAQSVMVDFRGTGGSGSTQLRIQFDNANTIVAGWQNDLQLVATSTAALNVWTHVAVVRSGTTASLYVNGISQASITDSTSLTDSGLVVGAYQGSSFYLGAYLSNIRVVKGTAVYTSNFTPPTTSLTAITNTSLLTCQSNTFKDNSSNNYAFTVNGNPSTEPFSPFAPTAAYSTSVNGGSIYILGQGSDSYSLTEGLSLPANTGYVFGTGDFTVECWYRQTEVPQADSMMLTNSDGSFPHNWQMNSALGSLGNRLGWSWWGNNMSSTAVPEFKNNVWYHCAVARESSTTRLFVNGVLYYSFSDTRDYDVNKTLLSISRGTFFISNARIIKGTALYTATFTPPTAPVTAISGTTLLLNGTNAGIFDNAAKNDLKTIGNSQISTSVKKYGTGSMSFDGTGDWLTTIDTPNLQFNTGKFTIECWVYLNAVGSARGFVSKGTSTTGWSLGTDASNQVVFSYGSSSITSTGTLSVSTWYFITVVREGTGSNQTKIYIAGTNDGTGTVSTDFNQTDFMYVGADRVGGSPLNGYIDDLRITKGVARYTANFTPPAAELEIFGDVPNIVTNSTYGVYQLA